MKKVLTTMAVAIAATAIGGYGDLPDAFNASTGYVTLDAADTLLTHSSFWDGANWSDGEPPHSTTNYYVNMLFSTLMDASVINAKLAQDPTALTFKGRMLVADAKASLYLYSANFDIPDLHMLPGSQIYWGSYQPEVHGRMTTYGTTTSPAKIIYGLSGTDIRQPFGMDVKGDASSWISVYAPAVKSGSVAYSGLIAFTGDLSEYCGTFKIANIMNGAGADHETHYGIELASSASNAAFAVESKGCVYATAPEGVEVRSLSIAGDDTLIRLNGANLSHGVPRLTVGDSMAANGRTVAIALSTHALPASGVQYYHFANVNPVPQEDAALIRLKPAAVANGGFGDLHKTFVWVADNAKTGVMTEWRDDADGGKTLWLCPYVSCQYDDSQAHASMANTRTQDGNHDFWSDGTTPADPASASKRYFSDKSMNVPAASGTTPFAFGGRLLAVFGNSLNMYNGGYGFRCSELVLNGARLRMCNASVMTDGRKDEEDGLLYRVYRIQGEKFVVSDRSKNDFYVWGVRQVMRIESELVGGGAINCGTFAAGDYRNDRSFYEFTALNTNFTGKINVSMPYETTKYASSGIIVPNWNQRTRLFVYDERNLGGRRDTFACDALYIDHYSELFTLNDVTFTDGWNRGIAIGDIGRMNVTNSLTLTILRPLNVNGNLVKEGAGTLALGGTLTFGGEAQADVPTSGMNLLTVKGGSIKPLAAHAFDGLAITFTNNASIKLDATTSDADLLNFGIIDVKETAAPITLAANQTTIPVTVTPPDGYPSSFTVAICTIGATPAANLPVTAFSVANTAHHRCPRVEKRTNGDGTVTYLAPFFSKGFVIDFR